MIRNWTFTLFFVRFMGLQELPLLFLIRCLSTCLQCMSELWGDVCLGLLFWCGVQFSKRSSTFADCYVCFLLLEHRGLANDTTTLSDAHTLYPLFGLGANVAQSLAGIVLKVFSGGPTDNFASQIRTLMLIVLGFGAATLGMYRYVDGQATRKQAEERQQKQRAAEERRERLRMMQQEQRISSNGLAGSTEGGPSPLKATEDKPKQSLAEIYRRASAFAGGLRR